MDFYISDKDKLNKLAPMRRGEARAAERCIRGTCGKVFGFCMNRVFVRATAGRPHSGYFIKPLEKPSI